MALVDYPVDPLRLLEPPYRLFEADPVEVILEVRVHHPDVDDEVPLHHRAERVDGPQLPMGEFGRGFCRLLAEAEFPDEGRVPVEGVVRHEGPFGDVPRPGRRHGLAARMAAPDRPREATAPRIDARGHGDLVHADAPEGLAVPADELRPFDGDVELVDPDMPGKNDGIDESGEAFVEFHPPYVGRLRAYPHDVGYRPQGRVVRHQQRHPRYPGSAELRGREDGPAPEGENLSAVPATPSLPAGLPPVSERGEAAATRAGDAFHDHKKKSFPGFGWPPVGRTIAKQCFSGSHPNPTA